jgi:hypothetical protein
VHGVDERAGCTTPNLEEAKTDRALIASARQVVVVADSTKWGVVGLSSVARLDDIDVLVTDQGLPSKIRRVLASRIGRLVLAESEDADSHDTYGRGTHGRGINSSKKNDHGTDSNDRITDGHDNGADSHSNGTDSNNDGRVSGSDHDPDDVNEGSAR